MFVSIPLGVLNAAANLIMWVINSLCTMLTETIYRRLSSRELVQDGKTRSTDCSEISLAPFLFSRRCRPVSSWWAIVLLLLNVSLLPLEILFEAGIDEHTRCQPKTVRNSLGVCAEPWGGHSEVGIAASALLTQKFQWVDQHWDFVLVGSKKKFDSTEVRVYDRLRDFNRTFLIGKCHVYTKPCGLNCGLMTVFNSDGPFHTVISNYSRIPPSTGRKSLGDLTWDKSTGMSFIFWENGITRDENTRQFNRSILSAKGIETVLSDEVMKRVFLGKKDPWTFPLNNSSTREYDINCSTDGLTSWDLVRATSLYRTMQMEQPGLRRVGVNGDINKVEPMSNSDIVKAVFAMKADDWSGTCTGDIDVYRKCGTFKSLFVLPFVLLATGISVGWVIINCVLETGPLDAPVDAVTWRQYAVKAMSVHKIEAEGPPTQVESWRRGPSYVGVRNLEIMQFSDTLLEKDMLDRLDISP